MLSFTKEQIKEIAEEIDCGFRAFYHKQKGTLIFVPDTERLIDIETDAWQEELDELEFNFLEYQEVYPMKPNDSFKIMADFTEQHPDQRFQEKLYSSLNKSKPFRKFKFVVDNSGEYRQQWFDFKNKRNFEWVEEQLNLPKSPERG